MADRGLMEAEEMLRELASRLVIQMQDQHLTRFSYEVEREEGFNIPHMELGALVLIVANEWGRDIKGSFHREPKNHGTKKRDEGYEPIDGQTLYF